MLARLLVLFVVVPLVELALLVWLGTLIGFWPTMAIVIGTGAVGAFLARSQGARVLRDIRADLAAGRMPASHLVDGVLILVGGIVLLTPGVLSDLAGIVLLVPATRARFKRMLKHRFEWMIQSGQVNFITLIR